MKKVMELNDDDIKKIIAEKFKKTLFDVDIFTECSLGHGPTLRATVRIGEEDEDDMDL